MYNVYETEISFYRFNQWLEQQDFFRTLNCNNEWRYECHRIEVRESGETNKLNLDFSVVNYATCRTIAHFTPEETTHKVKLQPKWTGSCFNCISDSIKSSSSGVWFQLLSAWGLKHVDCRRLCKHKNVQTVCQCELGTLCKVKLQPALE